MTDYQRSRDQAAERANAQQTAQAYRSVRDRLEQIAGAEAQLDAQARQRTGITCPTRLFARYGGPAPLHPPEFHAAMQRLWDIGSIDQTGRADTELRRPYHLIAKGKTPVTEDDVIALGQMADAQLRLLLPWLAHRLSLAESMDRLFQGELAPPIIVEE